MIAGEVRADLDVARAAEWVIRIVLSLVTVPGGAVDITGSFRSAAAIWRFSRWPTARRQRGLSSGGRWPPALRRPARD